MRMLFLLLCLGGWSVVAGGQPFHFDNASFEGEPQDATVPVGWFPCAQATTPDILPGPWGVYEEPSEGETFVGLITRQDGSWESIGQRLSGTLRKGECYTFSIDLAHSRTYAGYTGPLQLRVWGGRRKCDQTQLLFESPVIEDSDWTTYEVRFYAEQPINYVVLEAYGKEEKIGYRGNILIDHISPVRRCARASRYELESLKGESGNLD